eukprot:8581825-Karenia_brevis.AAC.1
MPSIPVPGEYFAGSSGERGGMTWRRYAFERAHMTFLEPHRPSNATWQALKRMAFWPTIYKDFNVWINDCAVCHQHRTVGVMAPMK